MEKLTVAIVGSHPLSREFAPWGRGIPIWLFNEAPAREGWAHGKECDALFQMHLPMIFRSKLNRHDDHYYEWLQQEHPFPIYMLEDYPDVPSAVRYPIEDIKSAFPNLTRRHREKPAKIKHYFTSSVCYALALAIMQGYERIEVYGTEFESPTEYAQQRDAFMYWVGIALGRGLEVEIVTSTGLLSEPLYGYEGTFMVDSQMIDAALRHWTEQVEVAEDALRRSEVLMQTKIETLNRATTNAARKQATLDYFKAVKRHNEILLNYGMASGILRENIRYREILDDRIRAAGGRAALKVYEYEYGTKVPEGNNHRETENSKTDRAE